MRLGLIYPSPTPLSPRSWSGTPSGLARGFTELGVEIVPIGVNYSLAMKALFKLGSKIDGFGGAVMDRYSLVRAYRTKVLSRQLDASGHLDAVLAMGTDMYDLDRTVPRGMPTFTYDDATLSQMWRHPDSDLRLVDFPEAMVLNWGEAQARSLRRADLCFTSTEWAAEGIAHTCRIDASRVRKVGMGHNPKTAGLVSRNWSEPRFLFVGLDWERKNGQRVLEAFREVRKQSPEAVLDIVGVDMRLDEPGVRVHGILARDDKRAQERLAQLFVKATCFAMPSKFDPSPISYLEAGSSGLPVIATTEGGAQELLGRGAIAVDPGDVLQISDAMLRMLDPVVSMQMSQFAIEAASKSTWVEVARRMLGEMQQHLFERNPEVFQ